MEQKFVEHSESLVDTNQSCYYPALMSNRWIQVRLDALGNIITFSAALFTIIEPEAVDPSEVGLIITYALNITLVFAWLVRMTTDVETNIVAVERIKEYSEELDQEADWIGQDHRPAEEWPEEGAVQFRDYGMRYREGLDLVLKDISCDIKGGETIGIVGELAFFGFRTWLHIRHDGRACVHLETAWAKI